MLAAGHKELEQMMTAGHKEELERMAAAALVHTAAGHTRRCLARTEDELRLAGHRVTGRSPEVLARKAAGHSLLAHYCMEVVVGTHHHHNLVDGCTDHNLGREFKIHEQE